MKNRSSNLAEAIHKRLKWALIIASVLVLCNVVVVVAVGPEKLAMTTKAQGTLGSDCQTTRQPIA